MKDKAIQFFLQPQEKKQVLYESLRKSIVENTPDKVVCETYKIKFNTFRSIKRDFYQRIKEDVEPAEMFFNRTKVGRREKKNEELENKIITLRRENLSVPDIKAILSSEGIKISYWRIDKILKSNNYPVLLRRTQQTKQQINIPEDFRAPESMPLELPINEKYESLNGSIILFYPILKSLNIERMIKDSGYPETKQISSINAILSFLALKLISTKRLSHSNDYGLDRGLGLFAGLNVLPKNSWFSSYSYRINREMNRRFLAKLNQEVEKIEESTGDLNLDFTTIPHWGEDSVLEQNWSGKRNKGLKSVLALIVQEQDSKFLKYGDAEIKHKEQSEVILEFIDFYKEGKGKINCLIFDSKFTTYRHLDKLNKDGIKFLTLRRRSQGLIEKVENLDKNNFTHIHLNKNYRRKHRDLLVQESYVLLKDYEEKVRQIAIINNGHENPTFIITNDFEINIQQIILKYAKRWLVEQAISEQIEFYHLNRLNSSIVVKVDFDLTMSIFADTVYKLFCNQIQGFENSKSEKIYRLFIKNFTHFEITSKEDKIIKVTLNKKVHLPLLFETEWFNNKTVIPWIENYKIKFEIGTSL